MKRFFLFFIALVAVSGTINAQQNARNYRIEPSQWAYSWGVGTGLMAPEGGLANHFNPGFTLDTELNVFYQKAFLMINGGFSNNKLKLDVPVTDGINSTYWPSGSKALHAFIGANLGVNFDVDQFSIYPFAGIGYGFIEPDLKTGNSDPLLREVKIDGLLINLGMGIDYNVPDKNYEIGAINRILKVGLRYQCQIPSYKDDIPAFTGTTHWVTLRFMIGSTFPGKKVYY